MVFKKGGYRKTEHEAEEVTENGSGVTGKPLPRGKVPAKTTPFHSAFVGGNLLREGTRMRKIVRK